MKTVYRVILETNEWIADFATLETAQRFVGNDEHLIIVQVFKVVKRED